MKVLVINGPNLSRLDIRDSSIYGDMSYPQLEAHIRSAADSNWLSCCIAGDGLVWNQIWCLGDDERTDKQINYTMDPMVWTERPYDLASIAAYRLGFKDQAIE